jgi:hypothetical protein
VLGLAIYERGQLAWTAREAAYAAAVAGAEDSACVAALEAVAAVSGRAYAACDGSDGLRMAYEPGEEPPTVTIGLDGSTWHPPFLSPVTVTADAVAIIRAEPSPAPSGEVSP